MKIVKEFVLREIAGECMLIPVGATTKEINGMISVSSSAKCIWENIEKVGGMEELIALILDEFDVEEDMARSDTMEFVRQLLAAGFIAYTDEDKKW